MKTAIALAAALAACGCAAPMPPGYVEVPESAEYEWRGMSSEGVVIGLRVRSHKPEGTLDFWSAVVRKELEGQKGYAFVASEEIRSGGVEGRALQFTVPGTPPTSYWLALFLTEGRFLFLFPRETITTFEAAGPSDPVRKDLPALRDFLSRLKL
jgi:hypothetical protein